MPTDIRRPITIKAIAVAYDWILLSRMGLSTMFILFLLVSYPASRVIQKGIELIATAQAVQITHISPTSYINSTPQFETQQSISKVPSSVPVLGTSTQSISTKIQINSKDKEEVIYIPAGDFIMGSNPDEPYFWGAEAPRHNVYLKEYWIYRTEVTNKMYHACVSVQACPQPEQTYSRTHTDYFTNPDYDNYPVIYVNHVDALAYCQWSGGRLPTEAEWEKAARGTDGRLFPWGNGELQANFANFCDAGCPGSDAINSLDDGYRDLAPVGSYPTGASPYGIFDMAGNALEWVADRFDQSYYSKSPTQNPLGPSSGNRYVIRGGSWLSGISGLRTVARASLSANDTYETVGFRCAMDSP